jgi:surface polysaccharide O-acyltransferase-like enzyme
MELFGREYIFKFTGLNGEPFFVRAGLWFVFSILLIYLGWFIIKRLTVKKQTATM